jgi:hypothetical protein
MGAADVKERAEGAARDHKIRNQAFQKFTDYGSAPDGQRALAVCPSRGYISGGFPDNAPAGVATRTPLLKCGPQASSVLRTFQGLMLP